MSENSVHYKNRLGRLFPGWVQTEKPGKEIFIGATIGVFIASFILLIFMALTNMIPGFDLLTPVNWCIANLQLSIIPFALSLLFYILSIRNLDRCLATPDIQPHQVAQADHLIGIWTNCFFGIGVIWTAIGMRSALLSGLSGLDAATAQELGAFTILQRLVDGGILIALSTTIFGGVGGYIMRIYKAIHSNSALHCYYGLLEQQQRDELVDLLHAIERNTLENSRGAKEN